MSSMTCKHSDELLTLGAMRLLSASEQTKLEEQLSTCPACRARWQQYQALVKTMPHLVQLETSRSQVLGSQPAPGSNGKAPHLPSFFEAGSVGAEPEAADLSIPKRPSATAPAARFANRRLVRVLSGLTAAVVV